MKLELFNLLKLAIVFASLPLLMFQKQWLFYILAINIGIASIFALYRRFWINGFIGGLLMIYSLYIQIQLTPLTTISFVLLYVLWNIYFTERVLESKLNNHGIFTSISMNMIPLIVFGFSMYLNHSLFQSLWYFTLIRCVLILFYYIHLLDTHSCHATLQRFSNARF